MRLIHLNEYQPNRYSILFLNGGGQIPMTRHQKIVSYFNHEKYNLIAVELPGHGKSGFSKIYTEEEYIDHLRIIFQTLILDNAIKVHLMVGFSLGGLLTLKVIEMDLFPVPNALLYGCGFGIGHAERPRFEYFTSEQFFIDQKWMPIMIKNHGHSWRNLILSLKNFLHPDSKVFTKPDLLSKVSYILLILGEKEELFSFQFNSDLVHGFNIDVELLANAAHFEYTTKYWDDFKAILDTYHEVF